MKKLFILFLCISSTILSAQSVKNYYVFVSYLNIHQESNKDSKIVVKLKKYDNIQVKKESSTNWIKISYKNHTGYVSTKSIKLGKAIVSNYSVRTGAECRDGSSSGATGCGACSHHKGVSNWVTSNKKSVRIEN